MYHFAKSARIAAVSALALASCATNPGPTTTTHDGMWSGKVIAPEACANSHYDWVDFRIHNGVIQGWQIHTGDEGARYILGTVYEDGTVRAYSTLGPHMWVWGLRPADLKFKGETFTLAVNSKCDPHTVLAGKRTGPVPWWELGGLGN
jgi:hypothetical protein